MSGKRWWTLQAERIFARARARARARAGDGDGRIGLLMIDLDRFKQVNDTHGHPAGDDVLRAVATAITGSVRAEDALGRFGGEEFVLLVPDIGTTANLAAQAERVRRSVHAVVVDLPDGTGQVTGLSVSIGAATCPAGGTSTVDDLVRAADLALYRAKAAGRDRIAPA